MEAGKDEEAVPHVGEETAAQAGGIQGEDVVAPQGTSPEDVAIATEEQGVTPISVEEAETKAAQMGEASAPPPADPAALPADVAAMLNSPGMVETLQRMVAEATAKAQAKEATKLAELEQARERAERLVDRQAREHERALKKAKGQQATVVVVSARAPCNGSSIPPADGWAQSARCLFCRDAARTWWAPCWNGLRGALVGRASRVRRCSARGSQADSDSKTDARYRIPRLLSQRHTAPLLNPGSSCTLDHRPHKHPDHPQSPCSSTARRPKNCQNPKFLSLRSMLREGADNWSARLCVASRSAIKGNQRHEIHHNYLPLGVVFDLKNNLVFSHLSLVFIGLVSPDHLLQLSGTCEVFCRYP